MIGKHSLDPWAVDYDRRVISEVTGQIIAVVPNTPGVEGPVDPEANANAEMMAAAPRLLEELIDFHDYMIDQDHHDCDGIPGGCPVANAIRAARRGDQR